MRLLVTGGLGFIGSNFILKTLDENKDIEIINIDAQLDGSNIKNLQNLKIFRPCIINFVSTIHFCFCNNFND